MNRQSRILATALLAVLPMLGSCDADTLVDPAPNVVDARFARYVSIGNSITAGFQSGGITATTQLQSYAPLLAEQMGLTVGAEGANFNVPLMNAPGCPPPYTDIFTQTRVMGLGATDCFLRQSTPELVNNVAVPSAAVIDVLSNLDAASSPNALTSFFLGGRTQLEAAALVEPTFVTAWIGNNDVLGAILAVGSAGDASHVTEPTTFATRYSSMMDELDAIETIEGGALIGVVQVGLAPYITQGRAWAGFELQFDALTAPLNAFDVDASCLQFTALTPTDTAWTSVPFHTGGAMLAMANAKVDSVQTGLLNPLNLVPVTMDCATADVVTAAEMVNLMTSVAAYNAAIQAEATERGWAYVDPNALLLQLAADPTAIRPFPAFGSTDPADLAAPFGTAISIDGVHPSASSHVAVANALIAAINAAYDTEIPVIN